MGDVQPIQLVEGLYAYVESADYEWASRYNRHLPASCAVRCVGSRRVFMHRGIMQPPKGMVVDHKDGNGLNYCRFNLRVCTLEQNQWNRVKRITVNAASQDMGVGYRKSEDKYYARFRHRGERFWLGLFDEEIEAARAYDHAAVEHRGEFARVNLPEEWPPDRRAEVYAQRDAVKGEGKKVGRKGGKSTPAAKSRATRDEGRKARSLPGSRVTSHGLPPPRDPTARQGPPNHDQQRKANRSL